VLTIEAFEAAGGPSALTMAMQPDSQESQTVGLATATLPRVPPGLPNVLLSRDDGGRAITVLQ
jgi:hypothetical protein